jgi:hypothetical protein
MADIGNILKIDSKFVRRPRRDWFALSGVAGEVADKKFASLRNFAKPASDSRVRFWSSESMSRISDCPIGKTGMFVSRRRLRI